MIVENMNDQEFVLEVIKDYFDEMRGYGVRALEKKGKIKKRHSSNYRSKRGNHWFIVYSPENGVQHSFHVKRPQANARYTWYSLILEPTCITLFGFTQHVADRLSERYHPELTPSDALKEMLMKTPAINQAEVGDTFYTRVNGGFCLGSVYGKRMSISIRNRELQVDLRQTNTFVSDDLLFDDQKKVTEASIARAIEKLGKSYLTDDDRKHGS